MLTQQTVEYLDQFPGIQPWIARMAKLWPVELRALLDRPFGDLGTWLSTHMENGRPIEGCMVGTFDIVLSEMLGCAVTEHWDTAAGDFILTEFYARCHLKFDQPVLRIIDDDYANADLVEDLPPEILEFHSLTNWAGLQASDLQDYISWSTKRGYNYARVLAEAILKEVIRHELEVVNQ